MLLDLDTVGSYGHIGHNQLAEVVRVSEHLELGDQDGLVHQVEGGRHIHQLIPDQLPPVKARGGQGIKLQPCCCCGLATLIGMLLLGDEMVLEQVILQLMIHNTLCDLG